MYVCMFKRMPEVQTNLKSFEFQQSFNHLLFNVVTSLDARKSSPVTNPARDGDKVQGSQRGRQRVCEQVDRRSTFTSTKTGGTGNWWSPYRRADSSWSHTRRWWWRWWWRRLVLLCSAVLRCFQPWRFVHDGSVKCTAPSVRQLSLLDFPGGEL